VFFINLPRCILGHPTVFIHELTHAFRAQTNFAPVAELKRAFLACKQHKEAILETFEVRNLQQFEVKTAHATHAHTQHNSKTHDNIHISPSDHIVLRSRFRTKRSSCRISAKHTTHTPPVPTCSGCKNWALASQRQRFHGRMTTSLRSTTLSK
jgi:hypothetical protein